MNFEDISRKYREETYRFNVIIQKKMDESKTYEDVEEIYKMARELYSNNALRVCWDCIDPLNYTNPEKVMKLIGQDKTDFFPLNGIMREKSKEVWKIALDNIPVKKLRPIMFQIMDELDDVVFYDLIKYVSNK